MYSLVLIIFVVSEKKAFEHFPIGSNAATAGLSLTLDPMGNMFQNASSVKPLGQLKPNCPGMITGRSSTNFMFNMPIGNPRWPPPQYIDYRHFEFHIGTKNVEFVEDYPMNIHVQFGFNNICSF
jgi:hypothetical protein